ncbi:MAG: type II secretion system minor pseudopilin GspK [Burkholderiales bacterium]|nr:type II secretion system minor pseudopilin GspK [Burkholderiales bacterium]
MMRGARRGACRGVRQAGVAIISVLLVITLATLIVSGLFWREHVTVRSVENRLALAQVRWIETAVLDWASVVLRVDQASTGAVDHLAELWATPVAETVLDETVTGGARLADSANDARLAGQIFDAQARLNLNNLVLDGLPSGAHREVFERLLAILGRPESLAARLQARLQQAYPPLVDGRRAPASALPLLKLADLRTVPGFDEATIALLEPYVAFLPKRVRTGTVEIATENTRINVNTAPAEVLAAAIGSIDLQAARRFVEGARQRTFFASLDVARSRFDGTPALPANLLSVGSDFFFVKGMIRFDRVESHSEALLYRGPNRVELIWQHRY